MTAPSVARTARERARVEINAEVLAKGREHLARDGAAALSLRAVARDLGMASSAVYRYVPTRDALLTLLIIDAYESIATAAEQAEQAAPRANLAGRFMAICHAMRDWALAHPHEYGLIFGSPVPGYTAPETTVPSASRIPSLLIAILHDRANDPTEPIEPSVAVAVAPMTQALHIAVPDGLLLRGLTAWAALMGAVSLEVFGHFHNAIAEGHDVRQRFFDHQMLTLAQRLELV